MCQTDTSARAYLYVLAACFSEDDKALFLFWLIVFCLFFQCIERGFCPFFQHVLADFVRFPNIWLHFYRCFRVLYAVTITIVCYNLWHYLPIPCPFSPSYFSFPARYFFLSPWYFSPSYKKKFVTKFVTRITNFVTCIRNFVTHVTNFVTKTIL